MADRLQPPPNLDLRKWKSDDNLSKDVATERKAVKQAAVQSKTD
jgi:hypothetical protein